MFRSSQAPIAAAKNYQFKNHAQLFLIWRMHFVTGVYLVADWNQPLLSMIVFDKRKDADQNHP